VNYAALGFLPWEQWNGKNPPSSVGQPAVVHLISENIYLSLTFNSWGGVGGAYSYTRSTPSSVPEPSEMALCAVSAFLMLRFTTSCWRVHIARTHCPPATLPL